MRAHHSFVSAQQNANNGQNDDDEVDNEEKEEKKAERRSKQEMCTITIAREYISLRGHTHIATSVDGNSSSRYLDTMVVMVVWKRIFAFSSFPFHFHNFPNTFNFICYILLLLLAPIVLILFLMLLLLFSSIPTVILLGGARLLKEATSEIGKITEINEI